MRSIAFCKVPVTSGLAPLLNPMWLSLIWTKEKSSAFALRRCRLHGLGQQLDVGTPPASVHSRPVPAHAMHPRKFRRSMPSPRGLLIVLARLSCSNRFISDPPFVVACTDQNCGAASFIPAVHENFDGIEKRCILFRRVRLQCLYRSFNSLTRRHSQLLCLRRHLARWLRPLATHLSKASRFRCCHRSTGTHAG